MDRIIDVNQHLSYNSIYEAINEIVGTNYKGWQQACWPSAKGTEKTNFRIWFPKLAVKRNGELFPAANDCLNVLSDDWNEMVFDRLNHAPINNEVYYTGYDMIIAKEPNGKYIFRGVFLLDKDKTYSNHYVSKRIGTKIKLVGTPAYKIEILDNCQEGSYAERAKSIDEEIEKLNLQGKERETLIKTRVGQGIFRDLLFSRYSGCCLCGVNNPQLLVASHIKPWAKCNPDEKLDADNGFLLCPSHDKLFDLGYITFSDDGRIIISKELGKINQLFMNINDSMKITLTEKNKKYLEYHRNNIFKK